MATPPKQERRKFDRRITSINLEVLMKGRSVPLRVSTSDLSVGGCYIQHAYILPIGTRLLITILIGEDKLPVAGIVKSCHTFGNGIEFLDLAPADRVRLESFLAGEPFLEGD